MNLWKTGFACFLLGLVTFATVTLGLRHQNCASIGGHMEDGRFGAICVDDAGRDLTCPR